MAISLADLRDEYQRTYDIASIRPERDAAVRKALKTVLKGRRQYELASVATGVPWGVIAVLHYRESDCDFTTHLHNGDPLTARIAIADADGATSGTPAPRDGVPIYMAASDGAPLTQFLLTGIMATVTTVGASMQVGTLRVMINMMSPSVAFVSQSTGGTTAMNFMMPTEPGTYRAIIEGNLAGQVHAFRKDFDFRVEA